MTNVCAFFFFFRNVTENEMCIGVEPCFPLPSPSTEHSPPSSWNVSKMFSSFLPWRFTQGHGGHWLMAWILANVHMHDNPIQICNDAWFYFEETVCGVGVLKMKPDIAWIILVICKWATLQCLCAFTWELTVHWQCLLTDGLRQDYDGWDERTQYCLFKTNIYKNVAS